jgi:phosphatidylserine/phosphatidylglycerophosphate/cardiolipin synthase-like enzyme
MKGKTRLAAVILAVFTILPSAALPMGSLPTGPSEEGTAAGSGTLARVRLLTDGEFQEELLTRIDSASAEIVLSTHLFAATEGRDDRVARVVERLAAAVDRGLEVIVVLEIGKETSHVTQANRVTARILQSRGVRVYADMSGTTVHSRLAVLDRRFVFVGSHDISVQSLGRYRETTLLVDSPDLASEALRFVESLDPVPYR